MRIQPGKSRDLRPQTNHRDIVNEFYMSVNRDTLYRFADMFFMRIRRSWLFFVGRFLIWISTRIQEIDQTAIKIYVRMCGKFCGIDQAYGCPSKRRRATFSGRPSSDLEGTRVVTLGFQSIT